MIADYTTATTVIAPSTAPLVRNCFTVEPCKVFSATTAAGDMTLAATIGAAALIAGGVA